MPCSLQVNGECVRRSSDTTRKEKDIEHSQSIGHRISSMLNRMSALVGSAISSGIEEGRRLTDTRPDSRTSKDSTPAVEEVGQDSSGASVFGPEGVIENHILSGDIGVAVADAEKGRHLSDTSDVSMSAQFGSEVSFRLSEDDERKSNNMSGKKSMRYRRLSEVGGASDQTSDGGDSIGTDERFEARISNRDERQKETPKPCCEMTSEPAAPNPANDCLQRILSSRGVKHKHIPVSIAELARIMNSTPKNLTLVDRRVRVQNASDVKHDQAFFGGGGRTSDGGGRGRLSSGKEQNCFQAFAEQVRSNGMPSLNRASPNRQDCLQALVNISRRNGGAQSPPPCRSDFRRFSSGVCPRVAGKVGDGVGRRSDGSVTNDKRSNRSTVVGRGLSKSGGGG